MMYHIFESDVSYFSFWFGNSLRLAVDCENVHKAGGPGRERKEDPDWAKTGKENHLRRSKF